MIDEYKLALIFQSRESSEIVDKICNKLEELTGENHKSIKLWLAIIERRANEVENLYKDGVNLEYLPFAKITPLIQTVVNGDINTLSILISSGADINKPNNDEDQASPLYCSLGYYGQPIDIKIVEFLLRNGSDANKPMFDEDTPMHMAHYYGHKEAIKLLLQYKGNINAQNTEGKTPLHYLLETKNVNSVIKLEIIKEFLKNYNLTANDQNRKTVIDYANEHLSEALLLFTIKDVDCSLSDR
ncbi:serine/threonine-protein phosphatase 6 regulatory ankyrin repeat subunit A [Hydra vulgaris]|uniref:serine/threonine-protein phosphatase 6 regulatory ankyrin repeat subunit A n=1 Tax=Hydra vulgaris TaxID=6087 RepID=UPI001F5FEC66|nr:serine/threonine-protein phosphatase 6 regulatory ankyrin repeat subunit A [Hydra vulgaris]